MSLDKAIKHGKERRKGYRERGKPGGFDVSCRPHGGGRAYPCPHCERNRLVWRLRQDAAERAALDDLREPLPARDLVGDQVVPDA